MLLGRLGLQSRLCWVQRAWVVFPCLPLLLLPLCSLSSRSWLLWCPRSDCCRRETLPFPVSLVQFFGWVGWEVPFCVSAHHHLDTTEKRKCRGRAKPSSLQASPPGLGSLTAPHSVPLEHTSSPQKAGCRSTGGALPCFCPCGAASWARKGSLVHVAGKGQQVRSRGCSQQGRSDKLSWGTCMLFPFLGLVSAQASPEPSLSTSPRCFQPNMELFSGRAGGRRKDKPAVRLLRGPQRTQSLMG